MMHVLLIGMVILSNNIIPYNHVTILDTGNCIIFSQFVVNKNTISNKVYGGILVKILSKFEPVYN